MNLGENSGLSGKGLFEIDRNIVLKLFFDAKSSEITNIYSEAYPNEQARIIKTLIEIDPSNSSLYQAITENTEGR